MYLKNLCEDFIQQVTEIYDRESVSLHEPIFVGKEKALLNGAIDSSFVLSREQVTEFEMKLETYWFKICGFNG